MRVNSKLRLLVFYILNLYFKALDGRLKIGTIDKHMEIYLIVIFGLMGASIGSFINVVVDRMPAGKS
jgi:hypothetical protein